MTYLESAILVMHVLTAIAVCAFVLLQHGKGADMGAAFGSGSSGSVFGSAGSANFLSRTTAVLATVFFATSLGLTYLGTLHGKPQDLMERSLMDKAAPAQPKAPDVPQPSGTAGVPQPSGAATGPGAAPTTPAAPKPGEVPK